MTDTADPVRMRHRELEKIANAALRLGRSLMESGACVRVVHRGMVLVAEGMGAEVTGLRSGYASLAITVASGGNTITRMTGVGRHGVDQRRDLALRALARSIAESGGSSAQVQRHIDRILKGTARHPAWLVAIATGTACAAFGRLLGIDWPAFAPVLVAGSLGQFLRHRLFVAGINPFVVAAIVAACAGTLCGLSARVAGSDTVATATIASILLLVPGVPATNAQTDIMEGYPTVGSARAVGVVMMMVFASTGIWFADALLGVHR